MHNPATIRPASRDAALAILSPSAPLGSAREMISRRYMEPAGRTIHHQQGSFYEWSGTRYVETTTEEMRAHVWDFLDEALRRTQGKGAEDPSRLVPFNPNKAKVANVLEALAAASQLPSTTRAPAWLDDSEHPTAADILACRNGLLHLPTRKIYPHTPAFFGLNAVDYAYDETTIEPISWLRFLDSLWGIDQESIETLQELFGLLLTADTSHQKIFLIVGPGRSGKGTIARVLTALLGAENVVGPTLASLSQNFGLAPLIGKRLAIISDARLGGRADVHTIAERILTITGEDALTVDRKYRDGWTGRLTTRIVVLTNELPKLQDMSGALASRFIVLRLTKSFLGKEDTGLAGKLLAELPSILHWAMDGRDRLAQRKRFLQPASAKQVVAELEDLVSPIGAFLRDRCVVGAGHSVKCSELYDAWVKWCQQHGHQPGTTHSFGKDLRAAVPNLIRRDQHREGENRPGYYEGVGLLTPPKPTPAPSDCPPPGHPASDDVPPPDDGEVPRW